MLCTMRLVQPPRTSVSQRASMVQVCKLSPDACSSIVCHLPSECRSGPSATTRDCICMHACSWRQCAYTACACDKYRRCCPQGDPKGWQALPGPGSALRPPRCTMSGWWEGAQRIRPIRRPTCQAGIGRFGSLTSDEGVRSLLDAYPSITGYWLRTLSYMATRQSGSWQMASWSMMEG